MIFGMLPSAFRKQHKFLNRTRKVLSNDRRNWVALDSVAVLDSLLLL